MSAFDKLNVAEDVAAILGDGTNRQAERHLSTKDRKERRRQAARVRIFADVPDWVKAEVMRISQREGVSASSLCAHFIAEAIGMYVRNEIDIPKVHCDSPRFEWLVDVPEDKPDFRHKGRHSNGTIANTTAKATSPLNGRQCKKRNVTH